MNIRLLESADIPRYFDLTLKLDAETNFRLYEDGERTRDLEKFAAETEKFIQASRCNIFIAEDESGLMVGYLQAIGRSPRRVRHVVSINIGILQEYTGRRIGGRLFSALEDWSVKNGVKRLDLSVMNDNIPAQKLYAALGFVREGVKRGSINVGGTYIDEYYMCKWLEDEK